MNHIDEGTIHAWLDGAVDATQSREIEAHVAQCSVCASAVAEARGLVAGASRILTALDDVPAGVTPKRAPMPRRQWRAAPWVTGIAAALVLAIGITTWDRGPMAPKTAMLKDEARPTVETVAPPPPAPVPAAPARPDESKIAARERQKTVALTTPTKRPVAADVPQRAAESFGERVPRGVAGGVSAAPPPAALGVRPEPSLKLDMVVVTSAPATAPSGAALLAGCYRLEATTRVLGAFPRVDAAAPAAAGRAPGRVAVAAAEYAAPRTPRMLRLDTLQKAMGFVVRAEPSDSTVGWWSRVGEDSARVDLLSGASFTLIGKSRVLCPER